MALSAIWLEVGPLNTQAAGRISTDFTFFVPNHRHRQAVRVCIPQPTDECTEVLVYIPEPCDKDWRRKQRGNGKRKRFVPRGIALRDDAVVLYKKYYVECLHHCKLVCNEEDTPCCRAV